MDYIDKKILEELQKNSSQPLSELSKKVGLSNTPCWNRIKKLEEEKIIKKLIYQSLFFYLYQYKIILRVG